MAQAANGKEKEQGKSNENRQRMNDRWASRGRRDGAIGGEREDAQGCAERTGETGCARTDHVEARNRVNEDAMKRRSAAGDTIEAQSEEEGRRRRRTVGGARDH